MNEIETAINRIAAGETLGRGDTDDLMRRLASGEVTGTQFGALAMGLRVRGETVDEIAGFAHAMRELSVPLEAGDGLIDTCGTGGDHSGSFNISTAAAFVAAGAGARVAKHGNRSISSDCGSADVLEALGANIELEPGDAVDVLDRCGMCFMFAPKYHPAMAQVAAHRRELRLRTVFNFLGPLTNPARVTGQVLGVADPSKLETMAAVLRELGVKHALVAHGDGGLDEISLSGPSLVVELRDGELKSYEFDPRDVGIPRSPIEALRGGDADTNAELLRSVISGRSGPRRDATVVNAAAALVAADLVESIAEGIERANLSIDEWSAKAALETFVAETARRGAAV